MVDVLRKYLRTLIQLFLGVLPNTVTWNIELPTDTVANINKSEIIFYGERLGYKVEVSKPKNGNI